MRLKHVSSMYWKARQSIPVNLFWCKHAIIFKIISGTCNFDKWKIVVNKFSLRWLVLAYHLKPCAEVSGATNFTHFQ